MRYSPQILAVAITLMGCTSVSTPPTPLRGNQLCDPNSKPLPPKQFESISSKSTLAEIIEHLGPAKNIEGSGITILVWECTDGRSYIVGLSELNTNTLPLYAWFKK